MDSQDTEKGREKEVLLQNKELKSINIQRDYDR